MLAQQGVGLGLGDAVRILASLAAGAVAYGPAGGVLIGLGGKALLVLYESNAGLAGAQPGPACGQSRDGEQQAGR